MRPGWALKSLDFDGVGAGLWIGLSQITYSEGYGGAFAVERGLRQTSDERQQRRRYCNDGQDLIFRQLLKGLKMIKQLS